MFTQQLSGLAHSLHNRLLTQAGPTARTTALLASLDQLDAIVRQWQELLDRIDAR